MKYTHKTNSTLYFLGDQILLISSLPNNVKTLYGEYYMKPELFDLFEIDLRKKSNEIYSPTYAKYLTEITKINPNKYKTVPLPKKPYITYQFDRSICKTNEYDNHGYKKFVCFTKPQINEILDSYSDYEQIDVGHKNYTLAETAYLMNNAEYHVGCDSGPTLLSFASNTKNVDIWYKFDPFKYSNITISTLTEQYPSFNFLYTYNINGANLKYYNELTDTKLNSTLI